MNNFEKLKSMSVEELAKWLDKNGIIDNSPWMEDFNKKYCTNCEDIVCKSPDDSRKCICAYCEIYDNCRFFPDCNDVPDGTEMAKLWLESEVKE